MTESLTTRVISICSRQHLAVWRLTSELLPRFVPADEYFVYVPRREIALFQQVSNGVFSIAAQEELSVDYYGRLRSAVAQSRNMKRFGWYLQQFHKIQALSKATADKLIIWDADCVPVRGVELFENINQPVFMEASEFNSEYFNMIERLLGLHRLQTHSFVTPGFPILKSWVDQFMQDIEFRHPGSDWVDAIIFSTDFGHRAGFSETETLGTWIANAHPYSWRSSPIAWERLGQSRFGFAKDFDAAQVVRLGEVNDLDIISFENWDLSGIRKRVYKIKQHISFCTPLWQR